MPSILFQAVSREGKEPGPTGQIDKETEGALSLGSLHSVTSAGRRGGGERSGKPAGHPQST